MKVAIIEYNAGNVQSVIFALERLGINPVLTDDHNVISGADKVVFPGVGEASSTMKRLKERKLDELIPNLKQPVLGICIGMQLMCKHSEEGNVDCLGIFDANVRKFKSPNDIEINSTLKVPHMGWNNIDNLKGKLYKDVEVGADMYFVHSYFVETNPFQTSSCHYGLYFCASMQKDNFYAVQYHTEKSSKQGSQLLQNFLEL